MKAAAAAVGTHKESRMNIVLLGPPGSGKGTQAKRLAETQNLKHLSTGDAFRDAIKSETELGREIKGFVESGKLVPDHLTSEVVFEKLKSLKGGNGILLDGYPRTLEQVHALENFAKKENINLHLVLNLEVKTDDLVKRLSARRQCPKCKEVYNLETRAPKEAGKCDIDGEAIIQRDDDKAEVIQKRLLVYESQTAPILEHFKGKDNFFSVNGAQDIDRVFGEIVSIIQKIEGMNP